MLFSVRVSAVRPRVSKRRNIDRFVPCACVCMVGLSPREDLHVAAPLCSLLCWLADRRERSNVNRFASDYFANHPLFDRLYYKKKIARGCGRIYFFETCCEREKIQWMSRASRQHHVAQPHARGESDDK